MMLIALCCAELGDCRHAREALVEMDAEGDAMAGIMGTLCRHNPSWETQISARLGAIRAKFGNAYRNAGLAG